MRSGTPSIWLSCLGLAALACGRPAGDDDAVDAEPRVIATGDEVAAEPEEPDDDQPLELEALAGCNADPVSFSVNAASPVGGPLVGFGAQFNANLFHPAGRFNQARIGRLATLLRQLRPQHVRIFFDARAFGDATYLTSFQQTVALAQSAGASINVTYWHGPFRGGRGTADFGKGEMEAFAEVLKKELAAGRTAIKYVTVQNEPNRTGFNSHRGDYIQLYKNLHAALSARNIRRRLKVIPELTRGRPGTNSYFASWLKVIGAGAGSIIDGYGFHIYWGFDQFDSLKDRRLEEIKDAIKALPAAQRKPIYVNEFGTRGRPDANKSVMRWPGWQKPGCTAGREGCRRIITTNQAGVSNAWFQVSGARAGLRSFVQWDAYWTMYDKAEQHWSMIGKPSDGLVARPTYHVQKLFTHVVPTGWVAVSVSDPGRASARSTAFRGAGHLTVVGVNKSRCAKTFRYSGLPAGKKAYVLVWNDDGSGTICSRGLKTMTGGKLSVAVHARSVVALSTRPSGLDVPSCAALGRTSPPDSCGDGECNEGETDANCGADCGCGADSCGTVAPFGCFCSSDCAESGDCCADIGVCQ